VPIEPHRHRLARGRYGDDGDRLGGAGDLLRLCGEAEILVGEAGAAEDREKNDGDRHPLHRIKTPACDSVPIARASPIRAHDPPAFLSSYRLELPTQSPCFTSKFDAAAAPA